MADLRKCVGSAKFGIEAHEAPLGDFPGQPSQKDGLGRMCKTHWKEYVTALTRARKAATADGAEPTVQSQAAARVATKRVARVAAAKPVSANRARRSSPPPTPEKVAKVRKAKALIDAIDVLPGPEHVAAIATDEAQAALEVLSEHVPGTVIDEPSPFALPDPQPVRDALAEKAAVAQITPQPHDGPWAKARGPSA